MTKLAMPLATPRFIGRKDELDALESRYAERKSSLIPIYGRRRVGKSELILRFMEGKGGLYYLAQKLPGQLQMRHFLEVLGRSVGDRLMGRAVGPDSWLDALLGAVERLRQIEKRKVMLVLDEFQWMAQGSPELLSVLQECWDRHWKRAGDVFVVLCGSLIGFMEREVLGSQSPLYGRRTAQLHLKPFGFRDAGLFHPGYSLADKAKTYFICGGIPLYLEAFDPSQSVEMNITRCFLDLLSPMAQEVAFLLREELRELQYYHAILMALGERGTLEAKTLGEITGLATNVQYYLEQLIHLGYVGRHFPLSEREPGRRTRYALEDPLLRFWFHFIFPNTSFFTPAMRWERFRELVQPGLHAYFGRCFERLCREALADIYDRESIRAAHKIGEFWDRDVQIDVVGLRQDGVVDLGECKWGALRSTKGVMAELEAKIPHFPNSRGATIVRRIFTRQRITRPAPGARWYSLADLYREGEPLSVVARPR